MNKQTVVFEDLGQKGYESTWNYQESLLHKNVTIKFTNRQNQEQNTTTYLPEKTSHHFLLVEHPPVFTLGKSGLMEHLLLSEELLKQRGIEFYKTNRGGDITYHGPGQIVGYPILDLELFYTDIGRYLRNIEEVIIRVMADYGLKGERSPGETGVWLDPNVRGKERKICAIGVRSSRWITMHGFAFNVNPDLDYFNMIIPCGIQGKQVTSLYKELGREVPLKEVKEKIKIYFKEIFDVEFVPVQDAVI